MKAIIGAKNIRRPKERALSLGSRSKQLFSLVFLKQNRWRAKCKPWALANRNLLSGDMNNDRELDGLTVGGCCPFHSSPEPGRSLRTAPNSVCSKARCSPRRSSPSPSQLPTSQSFPSPSPAAPLALHRSNFSGMGILGAVVSALGASPERQS